ncbi:MAG: flagellar biosynthesis protein FlgL [Roseovarius sp.]|nr:flagellar biosynthesis protein FlgL [Roseovarius sp.]
MTVQSIGDLARDFVQRRQAVSLAREMGRLTQEVSTGQVADVARHLSGHLAPLADIDRALALAEVRGGAARLAATDAALMQASLGRVQSEAQGLAETALSVSTTGGTVSLPLLAEEARGALTAMIGALNGNSADRALFAGDRSDVAPLADADTLLAQLRTALAGAPDQAAVSAALDAFFDAPGGVFESTIYRGGAGSSAGVSLGAGETVALRIRADDAALRAQIKSTAMAALIADESLPLSAAERQETAGMLGRDLLAGQAGVIGLRAQLGSAEARIAAAESRLGAERTSLAIARNDLVSADIYAAATALEGVQFQLEALYTITARTARLNLAAFLS